MKNVVAKTIATTCSNTQRPTAAAAAVGVEVGLVVGVGDRVVVGVEDRVVLEDRDRDRVAVEVAVGLCS